MLSLRYVADFEVLIIPEDFSKREGLRTTAVDISTTGLLVEMSDNTKIIQVGDTVKMHFDIPAATMPEGFESFVKLEAVAVRIFSEKENGQSKKMIAFEFSKPLTDYFQKKRWGYSVFMASSLLFIAVALVMLMRVESVIYFKYNKVLYFYSLVAATFLLTRYLFGALYREVRINPDFTPGVSIIIPCFNEEEWIHRTILSCMNQDYPIDKFEVIVVDDQSTDGTVEQIEKVVALVHKEAERYLTKERLRVHVLKENGGKRVALVKGVEMAKHDLVVFVDSDSF